MLQAQVLCQGPEWGPARRRESSAVVPAPALPSGLMMADNWQQNHDFLHRIEMWGWGWLAAERWDAARRASASPGKAGDSSCAFSLTQCHQEGRVCFSHCLPNFPIPRASSNFFAFSQVQELGNWDFSPKHALLCSAWPTCHCPWGAAGVSSPLVLRFHESGFVPDGIVEPWSYLGVPWVFWYRSCACCASAALRALLLCLEHGKAFMLQRGGAVAVRSELRLWVLCEHRQALLCQQSARGDGFCSISRPPIQVQALLAPVKLSDNLWAGSVPCEQMGWLSWQPRAWDAQLAEGNGSRAPRCCCPNACPSWCYPGKSRHMGCPAWARGVSQQRWYPHILPQAPATASPRIREFLRCFQPKLPTGEAGTCHCPVSSRDSPWRQQHSNYFLTTSAR